MARLLRVVYILFCFQVGIFLLVFPWIRILEGHSLLVQYPALRTVMMNNFVRGAVSGLGVVNVVIGSMEVLGFGRGREAR